MQRCTLISELVGHRDLNKVSPICLDSGTWKLSVYQECVPLHPIGGDLASSDGEIVETSDSRVRNIVIGMGVMGRSGGELELAYLMLYAHV
jgi:hypothetical protein